MRRAEQTHLCLSDGLLLLLLLLQICFLLFFPLGGFVWGVRGQAPQVICRGVWVQALL